MKAAMVCVFIIGVNLVISFGKDSKDPKRVSVGEGAWVELVVENDGSKEYRSLRLHRRDGSQQTFWRQPDYEVDDKYLAFYTISNAVMKGNEIGVAFFYGPGSSVYLIRANLLSGTLLRHHLVIPEFTSLAQRLGSDIEMPDPSSFKIQSFDGKINLLECSPSGELSLNGQPFIQHSLTVIKPGGVLERDGNSVYAPAKPDPGCAILPVASGQSLLTDLVDSTSQLVIPIFFICTIAAGLLFLCFRQLRKSK